MPGEPRFLWFKVCPLLEPRAAPTCTLLADGRVRVEGGTYYSVQDYKVHVAGTEVYSPDEDRWTRGDVAAPASRGRSTERIPAVSTAHLKKRERPSLTRISSREVLMTGGFETTCRFDGEEDNHSFREVEVIDTRSGEVQDGGQLPTATHDHGVVVLDCGAVLVIGGYEGDTHGSRAVQLGVPSGLDLTALGPALAAVVAQKRDEASREMRLEELRARGRTLVAASRFAEAVEPLRRAVEMDGDSPFTLVELADALFLCGKPDEAKPHYLRVVELCRDDATWTWSVLLRARQQLQLMSLESGELETAARGPGPEASSLEWNNAGTAASRLGRHEEACRAFRRATEIDPANDFAWGNLATTLAVLNRAEETLVAADRALELCEDPRRRAEAHVSRGIALYELGRFDESVAAYDASLELHVLPYAWNNRANSLRKLKRDSEALESYRRACDLGWHAAHWGRACILLQRGELEQAQAAVSEAARLDPSLVPQMRRDEELEPLWKATPRKTSRKKKETKPGRRPGRRER